MIQDNKDFPSELFIRANIVCSEYCKIKFKKNSFFFPFFQQEVPLQA